MAYAHMRYATLANRIGIRGTAKFYLEGSDNGVTKWRPFKKISMNINSTALNTLSNIPAGSTSIVGTGTGGIPHSPLPCLILVNDRVNNTNGQFTQLIDWTAAAGGTMFLEDALINGYPNGVNVRTAYEVFRGFGIYGANYIRVSFIGDRYDNVPADKADALAFQCDILHITGIV